MPRAVRHVVILGAAGQMTQVAARALCAAQPGLQVTLADRDDVALRRVAKACSGAQVRTAQLDLFDADALRALLESADFVLHGAGPFYKTADWVMRACIAAGASYMDIDDDVESTLQALELDAAARQAGVTLYVGHGASPGLSNVLGLELLEQLDATHVLELAWCVGEDREATLGHAVAEHTLHIGAGPYTGFREGRRVRRESYAQSAPFPLAAPLGDYRLYECAHPEPVMFGHTHPELRNVVCWGGLHPQPLNGALRGLARAVRQDRLGMDAACAFLLAATPTNARARRLGAGTRGQARAARAALRGIAQQLAAGECTAREIASTMLPRRGPAIVAIGARARGLRGAKPCELVARVEIAAPPIAGGAMAAVTGACEAAFFQLACEDGGAARGVAFPQAWVRPQRLHAVLGELLSRAGGSLRVRVEPS